MLLFYHFTHTLLHNSTSHLRIEIPDSLAVLPWELLCDSQRQDIVFVAHRRPIARLIPGGTNLTLLSPPLRVLLMKTLAATQTKVPETFPSTKCGVPKSLVRTESSKEPSRSLRAAASEVSE